MFVTWSTSIWLINIGEDHTKSRDRRGNRPIRPRHKEKGSGDVAAYGREQARWTESFEGGRIGRVSKQTDQATLRPSRRRRLRKPDSGRGELSAASI